MRRTEKRISPARRPHTSWGKDSESSCPHLVTGPVARFASGVSRACQLVHFSSTPLRVRSPGSLRRRGAAVLSLQSGFIRKARSRHVHHFIHFVVRHLIRGLPGQPPARIRVLLYSGASSPVPAAAGPSSAGPPHPEGRNRSPGLQSTFPGPGRAPDPVVHSRMPLPQSNGRLAYNY